MDVQALIDRCEEEHAQPVATPYKVIWPGQPGGYEPKVHTLIQRDAKLAGNFSQSDNHKPAAQRKKPGMQRPEHRSLGGLGDKADQAVEAYRQRGIEMERRRQAAREGKKVGKAAKSSKARAA